MLRTISHVLRGVSPLVPIAATALAALAAPASAQLATLGDVITAVGGLRTDTNDNANALTLQAGLLSGLRTDLGSGLAGVNTDVASLRIQVGELRGLLDDLPNILGPDGPLDLPAILEKLDGLSAANATSIANIDIDVANLRNSDVTQVARLDDHERRITQNTNDIRRHEIAINDLQSQMAGGLADVRNELRDHGRRIDKATEGVAMALAMKSPAVPENRNFAISGSFGAFENRTALAFAGGVRATDALQFDAGIAVGLDEGSVGGRAGATLAW